MLKTTYNNDSAIWEAELSGEIDAYNANELKLSLLALLEEKPASIVLDCAGLTFLDSTGLGILVGVLKKAQEKGFNVSIKRLRPHIAKIFTLTALDSIFNIEAPANE